MRKKLSDLLRVCGIECHNDTLVTKITCNSKEGINNCIFVAIKGSETDGNKYIKEAQEKGAIVLSEEIQENCIHIQNARETYALLLHLFYNQPSLSLKMVAITGTNGKSSTGSLICDMLRNLKVDFCFIGTHGIEMKDELIKTNNTTPSAEVIVSTLIQCIENDIQVVVMEVSSMAIKMHRVTGCCFDVLIYTNISQDHIEEHGSLEDYLNSKKQALNLLKPKGYVVYNCDDNQLCEFVKQSNHHLISYGKNSNQFKISQIHELREGTCFYLNDKKMNILLQSSLNVYNITSAMICGYCLDYNWCAIEKWIHCAQGVKGRFEKVSDNPCIYVDYAHTESAFSAMLEYFKRICKDQLIVVFGCGGHRDKRKRALMGEVACIYADKVIVTSDNPRDEDPCQIIEDIVNGCHKEVEIVVRRDEAIKKAIKTSKNNDIIIVVGKGSEPFQIIDNQIREISDRQLILSILMGEETKCII